MKPQPWLLPVSWLYGAGVWARNRLYDARVFRSHSVGVPVVSVGNITAGGTGKTPLVELAAKHLRNGGRRVAVLSRGYGRTTKGYQVVSNGHQRCADAISGGDEPAQMADNLEGIVVVVDEKRERGAERIVREFHSDIIILDDGFQHRSLSRSKDIVVITAAEVFGMPRMLPAGTRRESWDGLTRADMIVISGWQSPEEFKKAESRVRSMTETPVIGMQTVPTAIRRLSSNETASPENLRNRALVAFSGIGTPSAFERTVTEYLSAPSMHIVFPDHHRFGQGDLDRLKQVAADLKAHALVTTQKDGVRLRTLPGFPELDTACPVYVLEVAAAIAVGESTFSNLFESL